MIGTNRIARGEGSIWNKVVRDEVFFRWHFSSHSAAFGIGKLFSLIPNISSRVLPTPPTLPGRAFLTHPISLTSFNFSINRIKN